MLAHVGRVLLGSFMVGAGVLHLTTQREEFRAQVPSWFPVDEDLTVLGSGVAEIALGGAFVALPRQRRTVGALLAAFFVAIFPGNIAQYVEDGGNLLWLMDPDTPVTPEPLAKALGVTWLDGIVIDPVALQLQLPVGFFVPAHYPEHPALKQFEVLTIFPLARALRAAGDKGWSVQPLLESQPQAWVETSKDQAVPDDKDVQGPVTVGITLTREHQAKDAGAEGVGIHFRQLNRDLVAWTHEAGLQLRAWNPDTAEEIQAMIDLHPDGISSNRPDLVLRLLGRS